MARTAGIDYGLRRIGVALSDERKIIATALTTVLAERKTEATAAKLVAVLAAYDIDEIVIGLPLRMNGKMSLLSDEVKHFIELLKKLTSIPIVTWDERLTSVEAERIMRDASMNRKKRSKVIDEMVAVLILQNYLTFKGNG